MYVNVELIAREQYEDRLREAAQERLVRSARKSESPRKQLMLNLKYRVMRLGLAR